MIKSQITLKQLEAFAQVVDRGTFRAAAAVLGTTQPNISARIAALEAALGTTLLHRDAGSIRLTAKGSEILQKARDVLWAGEALLEEAGRQDLIEEGLRLGVTELVACTWLQTFLRKLKQTYPQLRLELQVDLSDRIEERLLDGSLDLAFQSAPFKTDLEGSLPLGVARYQWVAQPEVAEALGHGTDVSRFFTGPVLTHAKHTQAGRALHDMAAERGLDKSQIVHSSALSACLPMVCEGLGVALLPEALVEGEVSSGRLTGLTADWLPDPLSFFARYREDRAPLFVKRAAELGRETATPT